MSKELELIEIDPEHKMTKAEVEEHEKAIVQGHVDIGMHLLKIFEEHGWEAVGYGSFKEYCSYLDEKMSTMNAYRLKDQAKVNYNLSVNIGRPINLPMSHALALKDLEPDQQVTAFKDAIAGHKKGDPKPTEKAFTKAAAKVAPAKAKAKTKPREDSEGWTDDDLKKDNDLGDAFAAIEQIYGKDDTAAIQNGTIAMKKADVLFLAKLPKEKMREIQDIMFETKWTPKRCNDFLNMMPDENSTVEDLTYLCLGTKGKFWEGNFGGFKITCKLERAATR